jgi:gallate decarboxylase subunit D
MDFKLIRGEGRDRVSLEAVSMGCDLIVRLYNENPHIGAVAVGEYSVEHNRVSVSVITRLGHKDDIIAQKAAYTISHATRQPVCVVTGVHLDDISIDEINRLVENASLVVQDLIQKLPIDL